MNIVFWPLLDMILWGFNSTWIAQNSNTQVPLVLMMLAVTVLWLGLSRASIDFSYSLIDEIWAHNLMNLFSSPLTIWEWIISVIISSAFKISFVFAICMFFAWLIYGVVIPSLGFILIPFILSLALFGVTLGIITASFLIYWGRKIEFLVWMIHWIFAPICGVFYSITVLPPWLQVISHTIPLTFIFESIRKISMGQPIASNELLYNFILILVYFISALIFFKYMFEKSRAKGLARL
jgi:ABC-2 type transport system permease protein